MPPLNMDLINDPKLYMIGAGILQMNIQDPTTGLFTGYHDMGNATVFEPTNSDDRFKKFESRTRYRSQVADLLLRRNTDVNISLDEWSGTGLTTYFQGKRSAQASQTATPIVDEVVSTAVVLGDSYRTALYGPVSGVSAKGGPTGTVALTEGVDFVIDDVNVPMIRLLPTAVSISTGDELKVSYTPTAYATSSGIQIDIGQVSTVIAALRFIGDPANGPRLLFDYWNCSVRPNGGLPLLNTTNENTPLQLIASINSDVVNHPSNPIGRILQLPA